jgi:hypothetical protein
MEIDVVGINSKFAIAADCKHWKHGSLSILCMQKNKWRGQKFYLQKEIIFPLQYL